MAITLAHSSIADFPLFDDEQSFFSMSGDRQNGSFNHFVPSNDSNYSQSFIDMNMYQQQAQATAYDDTPSQYYHASHLVVNAPRIAVRHSAPQYTPSASPSTSLSHSGDQPSSILSTASNASMQSNTSSAVGSPYTQGAHVLTGQEQWAKSTSGLGFEHDFVQDEGYPTEIFPFSSSTESEPSVYSTDRNFGACVGESQQVSSSVTSSSVPVLSPSLSASTGFSSVYTASPSPSLTLEKSVDPRNASIRTTMDEYNERNARPFFAQPAPLESQSLELFQSLPQGSGEKRFSEMTDPNFRQPSTPASATSPTVRRRVSPFVPQKAPRRAHSRPGPDRSTAKKSSPIHHPYERRASLTVSEGPGSKTFYQAPFFNQSSGRFVPPLESTCWFSLICVVLSFFHGIHCGYFYQSLFSSLNVARESSLTSIYDRSVADSPFLRKPHSIKHDSSALSDSATIPPKLHPSISSSFSLKSGFVPYGAAKAPP